MSATPIRATGIPAGETDAVTDLDPRVARSRQRILDAATDLLVESGPRAVTVDAVSERSGVAKSTLYRHWDSREALLVEVMRCNVPQVDEPDLTRGFEPALRDVVRRLADTLADPEWARILPALISLKNTMPELAELAENDTGEKLEVLGRVLALGVTEGRLPDDIDVHLVAHLLFGPIVFSVLGPAGGDVRTVADYSVDCFLGNYKHT